jgi:plasmid stabilization system protein ParE
MPHDLRFLLPAQIELREARDFYDEQQAGLGAEFLHEIEAATQRILQHPEAWGILAPGIRRCLTHRFPYGVIYSRKNSEIVIISVFHLKRHPRSWRKNLR